MRARALDFEESIFARALDFEEKFSRPRFGARCVSIPAFIRESPLRGYSSEYVIQSQVNLFDINGIEIIHAPRERG